MSYPLINIDALVKELLALKAGQEELSKRVYVLEKEMADLKGIAPLGCDSSHCKHWDA